MKPDARRVPGIAPGAACPAGSFPDLLSPRKNSAGRWTIINSTLCSFRLDRHRPPRERGASPFLKH